MPPQTVPLVYATNPAGNEVTGGMVIRFPQKEQPKYRTRDLVVDDRFIQKVIDEDVYKRQVPAPPSGTSL